MLLLVDNLSPFTPDILGCLKQLGVDVYPERFDAQSTVTAIVDAHGASTGEALVGRALAPGRYRVSVDPLSLPPALSAASGSKRPGAGACPC